MSISVDIDVGYEFVVKAPFKEVFAVLSDVPTSASHFPKVRRLVDMGEKVYRWEMEKVGTAQINIQTIYASKYSHNKAKGRVSWVPVEGVGNAQISGSWQISAGKKGTTVELKTSGVAQVALPALMKVLVVPLVRSEFEKLVEQYIDNLIVRFGGEV